jgi:aldehyde dehydrogenase (NAD+)
MSSSTQVAADLNEFKHNLDQTHSRITKAIRTKRRDLGWRKSQLLALKTLLTENEDLINDALWKDFHKGPFESAVTEIGIVVSEIDFMLSHLESWMKPEHVPTPLFNQLGSSHIRRDPFGLTLVIGAWNYPIQLLLAPLAGSICGGNAAIIKPSELSANTAHLISRLVPKYLDNDLIAVVEGAVPETTALLDKKFDLIFFTGSIPVGKIVMSKAAANLTPVVLELGGKSPAIVLDDADIKITCRRLIWGKFMNAGQTCVAPDYVLAHPKIKQLLIEELKSALKELYGENVKENKDYCRIINERNFSRLVALLEGARILHGGNSDKASLFIEPTIVSATRDDATMQEEIFGPILPIVEIESLESAIEFVVDRPKPLALYIFSEDSRAIEKVLNRTSSGGVSINDVIMHMAGATLPFGGVGASGMGNYHGKSSFTTFTHEKGVYQKSTLFDIRLRYAPYTAGKLRLMKRFFR